jgi:hypothetical protein
MTPAYRKLLAAQELAVYRDRFFYQDRRLFEEGRYREIALRFRRHARFQFWLGIAVSLCFVAAGVGALVDRVAGPSTADLLLGISMIVFGFVQQAFWTSTSAQLRSTADRVLKLLERNTERGPEITHQLN